MAQASSTCCHNPSPSFRSCACPGGKCEDCTEAWADVRAWHASATYVSEFGQVVHGMTVGSYATITELIKYQKLYVLPGGDEVDGYNGDAPPQLREYTEFEE